MRSGEGTGFPHEGLAVACARRFTGRGVAMEDLLQEARAALCLAAERFDASRGVRFATYAVPVVLGALRACCRQAAPMHVPRREGQQLWHLLGMPIAQGGEKEEGAGNSVSCRVWAEPTNPAPQRKAASAASAECARGATSIGKHGPDAPLSRHHMDMLAAYQRMQTLTADPELAALAREDSFEERVLLRDAIRQLGWPYAQVIGLRYLCGLSQRQVGQRLHAEQWQVCRWEKMGLGMLREGWG